MYKLSVIIAAYNAEKTIEKCVESIFDSNYRCEVIVVNDASTDSTFSRLEKYTDRIKVINLKKNMGSIAKTRNIGLENSSGEYVTYLDSDDYYVPGTVDTVLSIIENYNPDIIRFGCELVYPNGNSKTLDCGIKKDEFVRKCDFKEKVYPKFINGIVLNSVCLAVFKKRITVLFPEDYCTAEDAAFCIDAYTNADSVYFLNQNLYRYNQHGSGFTGSSLSIIKKYKYNFKLMKKMSKYLKKWDMDNLRWRFGVCVRPIKLTVDKIKRKMG